MTKSKSLVVAVCAVVAATAASFSAASLAAQGSDGAIDRAVAAWAKVRTVRGTFEQTVSNSLTGTSATARGTYVQERPNKLAIRFSQPASDQIVSDGQAVWVYLPSSIPGQVTKRPATDKSAAPIDLTGQFLDSPRAKYDISPASAKTVDGHAAHGFNLVPKAGASSPFTKATVWIDDDDSLIREFEETESNGVTRHIHLTTMELNGPIDKSAFTFTVPPGVKVVDQTKSS
jgi:chaperone LolA